MSDIDFNALESVTRSNPSSRRSVKRMTRKIDSKFTLSQALFDEIELGSHSLTQRNSEEAVYLMTSTGNTGVFAKMRSGGKKGKTFKNVMLAQALDARGITDNELDLEYVGESGGNKFYQIIPNASYTQDEDGSPNLNTEETIEIDTVTSGYASTTVTVDMTPATESTISESSEPIIVDSNTSDEF